MNRVYIGSNTKMYKTVSESVAFATELADITKDIPRDDFSLFINLPYTALDRAKQNVSDEYLLIGSENMHWEYEGQFTGEISPKMLKELNINVIEIGHSERRHVMGETDEETNKKVLSALKYGFDTALLCIGETGEQKKVGISDEILSIQLKKGLYGVDKKDAGRIWIAYEPVWAIGVNGTPASADYADEKHGVIKSVLKEIFGDYSENIPVLYGGSVNRGNCEELAEQKNIDGLYIGRAAWQAQSFNEIIRATLPIFRKKLK